MGIEVERLRAEQDELHKAVELLKATKQKEEAQLNEHELRLKEANDKLSAARAGGGTQEALFNQYVAEFRKEGLTDRAAKKQELLQQWENTIQYLEGQRRLVEREEAEAYLERKKLQQIKVHLREQGVAEFQTYTPSDLGSSPPAVGLLKQESFSQSAGGTNGKPAPSPLLFGAIDTAGGNSPSAPFARPFDEETDVKIADHHADPATPGNLVIANGSSAASASPTALGPTPVAAGPLDPGTVSPAGSPAPFGKPFDEATDVRIADHAKSPATPGNLVIAVGGSPAATPGSGFGSSEGAVSRPDVGRPGESTPMPLATYAEQDAQVIDVQPVTAVAYPEGTTPAGLAKDAVSKGGAVMRGEVQTVVTNVRVIPPAEVA